jgi:hypothetical protein
MGREDIFLFRGANRCRFVERDPQRNSPGPRTVNDLVDAVRRNLSECRRLWWLYQQNNPQLHTEGACCLNNTRYGGKIVIDATYDPGIRSTQLQFSDGTTMILPM